MVCGGLCSEMLCVAPEVTLTETERTESQAQGPLSENTRRKAEPTRRGVMTRLFLSA